LILKESLARKEDIMTTIKAFIRGHPLLTYFALAFAISWGGVLIVVGPGGIPGTSEQTKMLFPFVYLAMLAGPSVAGILLTGLVYGRAGLRELLSRLLRWRVGARWYAVALLSAPLLMTAVLLALSLTSPMFLPGIFTTSDKATLLLSGIAVGLVAGFFEELGWTGFAVPTLLRLRHGVLATGLIVGVLWGAWHFLVAFWASGSSSGALSLALFLPAVLFSFLPAYRVLMVWVYDRSEESLLVAMLMHTSLTASTLILMPLAISGVPLVTYDLVLAGALWVVVGAVAVVGGGHISRTTAPEEAGGLKGVARHLR
jgi:membrane protease YdiL (CAAX protease family)